MCSPLCLGDFVIQRPRRCHASPHCSQWAGGSGESYRHLLQPGDLVIAADGGARIALRLGLQPQVVIGDLDSLPSSLRSRLQRAGCQFLEHSARKDETDTELAIRYALQAGAEEIVLLGALGGRLDHTLANVLLLGMPELAQVPAKIVSGGTEVWLLRGGRAQQLQGQPGDIVTLLPLGQDAVGITTDGWSTHYTTPLCAWTGPRGEQCDDFPTAEVHLRGGLLLVLHVQTG